jgi:hypothetical protein
VALALQLLAVLAAAALVRTAAPHWRWHTAVAVLAALFGLILFGDEAWNLTRNLLTERSANAKLAPQAVKGAGGVIFGAREDFLSWVDDRLPRRARVFLVCRDNACAGALPDWITYRLSPRRFVDRLQDADYVVVYNATVRDAGLSRADARGALRFAPRFLVAQVSR